MDRSLGLAVTTSCPACGAPLGFPERATTVRCAHCGSRLLLTGRGRVLAYLVRPRIDAARAAAAIRARSPRATRPALHLLPYYRFVAEEFRWERPPARPASLTPFADEPDDAGAAPVFGDRVIERNFLACRWDGADLYSLGVRPAVLALAPFDDAAAQALGTVVAADLSEQEALAHALRAVDPRRLIHRAVVGGVLSLVYFPYWVASDGAHTLLVDGVSGAVASEAPAALGARLAEAERAERPVVGLRPLVCPNCGWDLPDEPADVIFFCSACQRAWQVAGERLAPEPCRIAGPPPAPRAPVHHLPLWLVDVHATDALPPRLVVPAFRHRGLALLLRLATRLSCAGPTLPDAEREPESATGASVDRSDALALARFVATGIDRRAAAEMEPGSATLVWWPFEETGGSLREPVTGFAIPLARGTRPAGAITAPPRDRPTGGPARG